VALVAQLAVQAQGVVRGRRVFHVDADEVPTRRRVLDDRAQVVAAELVAELQPESRHLDAHAGVETAALDVCEYVELGPDPPASRLFRISSPRTSMVAAFPSACRRRTVSRASLSSGPAM